MLFVWAVLPAAYGKKPVPTPPTLEQAAATLVGNALLTDEPYLELRELCDTIGHRISGSPELDRAITWAQQRMSEDGLANVRAEPVTVPVWIRGESHAEILAPMRQTLHLLALGGSAGTGPDGIEGEVMVVGSFDELAARKEEVVGKIVLFDVPFTNYGATVAYRGAGPSEAAKLGAKAALVRSVTSRSLDTPHTGATHVADGVPAIPAAALTIESASQIRRWVEQGQSVRLRLVLGAHEGPDAQSANVVGEVLGREHPEEIVLLGCHLDSWDVGQGAQDDGAGCVTVMGAADLIASLPVRPRRTVRVVLYTNEENGLAGGRTYAKTHASELVLHVAALEVDTGAGQPQGFRVDGSESTASALIAALQPAANLLVPLGAKQLSMGHGGADIGPLGNSGVYLLGLAQDTTDYWPIHHTRADTFDKIDPTLLAKNVAATAVMAWALAELPLPPRAATASP